MPIFIPEEYIGPRCTPLFDNEDADLRSHPWRSSPDGYAYFHIDDGFRSIFAHHCIFQRKFGRKTTRGEKTDHINRDRLDNRRVNIRVTNARGNSQNRSDTAGRYLPRGVTEIRTKKDGKKVFVARAMLGRKTYQAGTFSTPEAAGIAAEKMRKNLGFLDNAPIREGRLDASQLP